MQVPDEFMHQPMPLGAPFGAVREGIRLEIEQEHDGVQCGQQVEVDGLVDVKVLPGPEGIGVAELGGDLDERGQGHTWGAVGGRECRSGGQEKLEAMKGLVGGIAALGEGLVEVVEKGPEDTLKFGDERRRGGGVPVMHVTEMDKESLGSRLALGFEDHGARAQTGKAFGAEVLLDGLEVGPEGLGVLG